jgi:molecular chaperone GrpE
MAEKERTEVKTPSHDDCCGGHCENEAQQFQPGEETSVTEVTEGNGSSKAEDEINWKTQAAYMAAELENVQKRLSREMSDIRKYANEDILKRVVPVLDTLTLALSAAEKAKAQPENETLFSNKVFQSFLQGVAMTAKQFEQILQASGVEFVESEGKIFDPNLHEALGHTHREDVPENTVTEVFQRGFKLGGRVIRHAKVMVNKT